MTPELAYGRHYGPPAWNARLAAVLLLLYMDRGQWRVPLTMRPDHMVDHAGQISFPGGMHECGETAEACAVREYEEELGPTMDALSILGRLTPVYVFASNFWVTPCVATVVRRPSFRPNPDEVARLLEYDLTSILDPARRAKQVIRRSGIEFTTLHMRCGEDRIWGATGMILAEFAQVVADAINRPGGFSSPLLDERAEDAE
jgi:8-oxo-dGTP pyrophosphatase MutT (NUDIX family)